MRRDVFQAIADPTRREILELLATQTMNLNAVSDNFNISRPAISKHIRILTECGLIIIQQEGRERQCKADLGKMKQVVDWTNQFQVFWNNKLDALESFLATEQQSKKSISPKNKK
ncbi:MAG: metalloregulator ArsR/SmtB family transcription factor [Ferruginibacter sp.]